MAIIHGGNIREIAALYQLDEKSILDFSANINPLGMPEKIRRAMIQAMDSAVSYPDLHYTSLKKEIAGYHQIDSNCVYPGNGATDAIFNLAQVLEIKKLLLVQPTFMEYEGAFQSRGTAFVYYPLEKDRFVLDIEKFLKKAEETKADGICLCNPNNPTGQLISKAVLLEILQFCRKRSIHLIADEAFIDFTDEAENSLAGEISNFERLYIIRSLTKMFAVPGIRIGYLLTGNKEVLEKLELITPSWHINSMADAAGQTALKETAFAEETRRLICRERAFLSEKLGGFDLLEVYPGTANFLFFRWKGKSCLQEKLIRHRILIRKCDSFKGLTQDYYRIAVRGRKENLKLTQALEAILAKQ